MINSKLLMHFIMQILQQLSHGESLGTASTPFTLDTQFASKCGTLAGRQDSVVVLVGAVGVIRVWVGEVAGGRSSYPLATWIVIMPFVIRKTMILP